MGKHVRCSVCGERMVGLNYTRRKHGDSHPEHINITKKLPDVKICDNDLHPKRLVIMDPDLDISCKP